MKKSFLLIVFLILVFGTTSVALAYPPAGHDEFLSTAVLVLNIPGLGTDTVTVTGPTIVNRGSPFDPGDGKLEIPTEIVSMQLTGTSSLVGPITVTESLIQNSTGKIKQQTAGVDFPADSFFDVFVEIQTGAGNFHNNNPVPMQAEINSIPPYGTTYTPPSPIQIIIYDQNENPVGTIEHVSHKVDVPHIIEHYQKVSMPDFGQHSSGWCWVAAAKNSFWWFSEHGFPQLEDNPARPPGNGEWKEIDHASKDTTPDGKDNDGDGRVDEDHYDGINNDGDWFDYNGDRIKDLNEPWMIDEDGNDWYDDMQDWTYNPVTNRWEYTPVPPAQRHGYRKDFRKFAEATWRDKNKNGQKDPEEQNYIYSEGVQKWDYLLGLANFIKIQGAAPRSNGLVAHDIADPAHPFGKVEPVYGGPGGRGRHDDPTVRDPEDTSQDRATLERAGIGIVFRPPTFLDYARDLLHSEDVILMSRKRDPNTGQLSGGHVVTGASYEGKDTNGDGKADEYWIDFSDPWTHKPATQPGDVPPAGQPGHDDPDPGPIPPDHNNSPAHDKYPYDKAKVLSNNPFIFQQGTQQWQVVDLIFISPITPKYRPVGLLRLRGVTDTISIVKVEFTYKRSQTPVQVTELTGLEARPGQTRTVGLPRGKYPWPDDIHITYKKNGILQPMRTIPTYLQDRVEDPAPLKKYGLSPEEIEFEEEPIVPTGVNTYWLAALALLAMAMGFVVMKRAKFLRA